MTCTCVSGGGSEFFAGVWLVTATPRLVTFELIEPPRGLGATFLSDRVEKMTCPASNRGPHALRDWGDGTYTVYPFRGGTPYVFARERPPPSPRG